MKKKNKFLVPLISVLVVLGIIGGVLGYFLSRPPEPVNVYSIQDCYLYSYYWGDESYTDGIVASDKLQTVYVSPTQEVTQINVQLGQHVMAGDPLVTYDTTLSQLSLDRQKLDIDRKKIQLNDAKAQLTAINKMKPIQVITKPTSPTTKPTATTAPPAVPKPTGSLNNDGYQIYGDFSGTKADPIRVWVRDLDAANITILVEIIKEAVGSREGNADAFAVLEVRKGNVASGEVTTCVGIHVVREEIIKEIPDDPTQPTNPTEPTDPTDPTNPTDPTDPPDPTDPVDETEPTQPEPDPDPDPSEDDTLNAASMLSYSFYRLENRKEYKYTIASLFSAKPLSETPAPTVPPTTQSGSTVNMNSGYTESEIAQMKKDKQAEIKELEFAIKMAESEYKIMQKEFDNGVVTADIEGYVVAVMDAQEAMLMNEPVVKVSGGGGFTIQGSVSELRMDTIQIGDMVQVDCWMSGTSCMGTITEIGDYPVTNQYGYYGEGNPNVSFYPFTVTIDGGENLQTGEYAQITYSSNAEVDDSFYMNCAFLRNENGVYYAFVDNGEGILEKRRLVVGQLIYNGSAIKILDGLTMEDYVAFPYGTGVKDGVPAVRTDDMNALYGY